jgi:hypothetical protein
MAALWGCPLLWCYLAGWAWAHAHVERVANGNVVSVPRAELSLSCGVFMFGVTIRGYTLKLYPVVRSVCRTPAAGGCDDQGCSE